MPTRSTHRTHPTRTKVRSTNAFFLNVFVKFSTDRRRSVVQSQLSCSSEQTQSADRSFTSGSRTSYSVYSPQFCRLEQSQHRQDGRIEFGTHKHRRYFRHPRPSTQRSHRPQYWSGRYLGNPRRRPPRPVYQTMHQDKTPWQVVHLEQDRML